MGNRTKSKTVSKSKIIKKGKTVLKSKIEKKEFHYPKVPKDDSFKVALSKFTYKQMEKKIKVFNISRGSKTKDEMIDAYIYHLNKPVLVERDQSANEVQINVFHDVDGTFILIRDEDPQTGEIIESQIVTPEHLKSVKLEKSSGGVIQVSGQTISDKGYNQKIIAGKSIEKAYEGEEKKRVDKVQDGVLWYSKPVPPVAKMYERKAQNYTRGVLNKQGMEQKAAFDQYMRMKMIPFLYGRSMFYQDIDFIQQQLDKREVEWVAESSEKMKGIIPSKQLSDPKKFASLIGNQVQTQIDTQSGEFLGLYYQNAIKQNKKFNPTMYRAKWIRADPDPIGQFQAWVLNTYAWKNPMDHPLYDEYYSDIVNVVDIKGNIAPVNYLAAMKGLSGSIVDSLGVRRNGVAKGSIKEIYGKSALAYLPKGAGTKSSDLSMSDQMVRACGLIVSNEVEIEVHTPTFTVSFPFVVRGFKEKKPILKYVPSEKSVVRPLDSDTLLLIASRKLKLDGISIQHLLEALYQQKWISYPRATATKAEAEPIFIKNPKTDEIVKNGEKAKELVNSDFRGTLQEKQLLDLIVDSQIAFDQNKPFVSKGSWLLISGDLKLESKTKDFAFVIGDKDIYTADQINIEVGDRGILEPDLIEKLVLENVATPATRTKMLEELGLAGVINRRGERLLVDRRGYFLAALDEFYELNSYPRSYYLKDKIYNAKTLKEVKGWLDQFKWLSKDEKQKSKEYVSKRVQDLIEAEHDLAYLDKEGNM